MIKVSEQKELHDLIHKPTRLHSDLTQWATDVESFLRKTGNLEHDDRICLAIISVHKGNSCSNQYKQLLSHLEQLMQ